MKRFLAILAGALLASACGDDAKDVAVAISPATITLAGAGTQQFTATVTNTSDTSVTWSVQEGAAGGTVTAAGLYTAPNTAGTYHVVATSVKDPAQSATAIVTVVLSVAVDITTAAPTLIVTTTQQFAVTVLNASNTAVTWSVQEGAAGGTITAAGLYTAPATAGTYHVIATSVQDTSKSDTVAVTVNLLPLSTAAAINTYLTGKTWKMTGDDIPTHPNGFNQNVNFGASTQCYNETVIAMSTNWTVTSKLGTLNGAPTVGSVGTCDRTTPLGNPLTFTSAAILIENASGNGECFDVTATYTGFGQQGRAKLSPDGRTLTMELFFAGQATGHRCASGAVGAATVTLNGAAFTGNAKQVYRLQ